MSKENAWDYLFYSYKANLPLEYRNDLDKLHNAVNVIIESEINHEKRQIVLETLWELHMDVFGKCWNKKVIRIIDEKIKELEGVVK